MPHKRPFKTRVIVDSCDASRDVFIPPALGVALVNEGLLGLDLTNGTLTVRSDAPYFPFVEALGLAQRLGLPYFVDRR